MSISGVLFILTRILQLIITIPIIGMLSWFVHGFIANNQLTPTYILVLFIVSVLAGAWVLFTLIGYAAARHSGWFLAFIELCFFAVFIAGVYELHNWAGQSCNNVNVNSALAISLGPFNYQLAKSCNMLKACFALGIIDILLFFWTFLLSLFIHRNHKKDDDRRGERRTRTTEKYERRSRHRSRNDGSRGGGYDDRSRGESRARGSSRRGSRPPRERAYSSRRSDV